MLEKNNISGAVRKLFAQFSQGQITERQLINYLVANERQEGTMLVKLGSNASLSVAEIDLIFKSKTEPSYHELLSNIDTSLSVGEIISVSFQK
jgi:hypothetical protein